MNPIEWKIIDNIESLPESFWTNNISKGDILKPKEFVKVLEKSNKNVDYEYIAAFSNGKIVGFVYVSIFEEDLVKGSVLPVIAAIRKLFPKFMKTTIAMTGAMETVGEHWWYDSNYFSQSEFFIQLYQQFKDIKKQYDVIIFRDLILEHNESDVSAELEKIFKKLSFSKAESWPFARIKLDDNTKSIDDYLKTLKVSGRRALKRAIREHDKNKFTFIEIKNYSDYIDDVYPLYLKTSNQADDFKREPLPKQFFIELANEQKLASSIQIIKNNENIIIAFVLSFENQNTIYPYLLGRDYAVDEDVYLIYQIYYFIIQSAIKKEIKTIELGITSYFVKQRLGAILLPMYLFIRLKNPILNFILKPILPKMIK